MRLARHAVIASFLLTSALAGQSAKTPARPKLPEPSDSNDAAAYFRLGLSLLPRDPYKASDSFYWASRIDPTLAEPWYARRVALLLQSPTRLRRYLQGERGTITSKDIQQIDSLQTRAFMLNPFLHRQLDRMLLNGYYKDEFERAARSAGSSATLDPVLLDVWVNKALLDSDVSWHAWSAYMRGDLPTALAAYGVALQSEKERNRSGLYADRARVHYMLGQFDSAHADLRKAVETLRTRDDRQIVYFYESKALYEQSIGLALERKKDLSGAKEAYGRALQEDLSYHPAHLGTARIALLQGDTAAAIAALDLAAQAQPADAGVRFTYASVLRDALRYEDAAAQLRKAIELEPLFAAPYYALGQVLESLGKPALALEQYRAFLLRAALKDLNRAQAQQRVNVLSRQSGA